VLDPATAEVKRMYVEPDLRGKRLGRALLDQLEIAARALGVRRATGATARLAPIRPATRPPLPPRRR